MNQQLQDSLPLPSNVRRKPSLAEQLTAFKATMLARMTPDDADVIRRFEAAWATAAAGMLRAGDTAPDFTLLDQHGRTIRLRERLALGPVAVLFIRGGWCPFCTIHLRAWAEALPALHEAGGDLLAISPQPVPACGNVAERDLLAYPVLSDRNGAIAAAFGVNWEVPEFARPLYLRLGHDLPVLNGDGSWRTPLPGVFVLDRDGRITLVHTDRAVARRLDPAAVIAAVQAIGTADAT